jgi:stage II sporulation protein D
VQKGKNGTGMKKSSKKKTKQAERTAKAARREELVQLFEGKPVFACYSRSCGGTTESAAAVWSDLGAPFLRSRSDPYCTRQTVPAWHWRATPPEIAAVLQRSQLRVPPELPSITVAQRTPSGRARVLLLAGNGPPVRVSASSFRFAIGRALGWKTVRSDRFEIGASAGRLTFQGSGEGHGVGLCQLGADQMGLEGHGYREILAFYYPGTSLGLTARGFSWSRLGTETVALMTTQPDRDRAVLALAERYLKDLAQQTNLPVPAGIELRIYPDVETFRNATGEPGWVAARTAGRRIHLQPAAALRSRGALDSTLRHELLHVLVEAQAMAGLPVWFREGLVGYLAGYDHRAAPAPSDSIDFTDPGPLQNDLRQTVDATRARNAYAAATRKVAGLADRYGVATLLTWLRAGLPREVAHS